MGQVSVKLMNANWIRVTWSGFGGVCDEESELLERLEEFSDVPGVRIEAFGEEAVTSYTMNIPRTVRGCDIYEFVRARLRFSSAAEDEGRGGVDIDAFFPPVKTKALAEEVRVKRPLFPHQVEGMDWLCERGCGLLADDMGVGKTSTAIAAAMRMRGDGHVLVIAPKFTRAVWRQEMLALGIIDHVDQFLAIETVDIPDGFWDRAKLAKVWFIQGDLVKYWNARWGLNPVGRPSVAIIDEIHWFKNPTSQRTQALLACIAAIPRRIGLTGTPVANKPRDLWALLTIICGTDAFGSNWSYRRRYIGAFQDAYGLQDGVPTHTEELQQRLKNVYLRRTIEDTSVKLPELIRSLHHVELAREFTSRVKKDRLELVVRALQRGTFGPDTLRVMQQLSKETSEAKVGTTIAVLEELAEAGEAAVVFCQERVRASGIAHELGRDTAFYVHGELDQDARDALVADYQAGKAPPILVATFGALREGVTLHRARHVILHDLDWLPSTILQAEKRVHRIGQVRTTFSRWMVLPGSFDTLLAAHLNEKARQIGATVNDTKAAEAFDASGLTRFNVASFESEVERFLQQGGL